MEENKNCCQDESEYQDQMMICMTKDEYARNCKVLEDGAKNELMEALIYLAEHKYNINIITESGREVNSLEECCRYLSADQIIEQAEIMNNNFNNLEKMLHPGAEVITPTKNRYIVLETKGEVGKANFGMRCLTTKSPFIIINMSTIEVTATGRNFPKFVEEFKSITNNISNKEDK